MFLFLINNLFGTFLTYKMVEILLKKPRFGTKTCGAAYFMYYLINSLVYFVFGNDIITLVSNYICLYVIVFLIYDDNIWKKALVPVLLAALGFCTEEMFWYLMMGFRIQDALIVGVLTNLVFCVILAVLHGHFRSRAYELHPRHMNLLLITLPIASIVLMIAFDTNENTELMAAGISGIVFLNIAVFFLYEQLVKAYQKEMEQYTLSRIIRQYENQIELMKDSGKRISAIRHDMKNHVIVLKRLIGDGKMTEAGAYLEQLDHAMETEREYVKTGNDVVDSILNFYVEEAKGLGTRIALQIQIPSALPVSSMDISVILGNLMQNAVEALRNCEGEKKLRVILKYKKGILRLIITNTYNGKPLVMEGAHLKSTKLKADEHGYGIQNVLKTVKKYEGDMEHCIGTREVEVNVFILIG